MSVGYPSGLERTCPNCGAVQESPGSTVCEQCGTDLLRPRAAKPSSPKPALQLKFLLKGPAWILRRVVAAVQSLLYLVQRLIALTVRLAVLLLILGALIVGVSFVPAVNARVPATKEITAAATQWLRRAQEWAGNFLPALKPEAQPPRRTAPAAATTPKPGPAKPVVTQPLKITSTPSGATVRLGTRSMGKTPLTLKVAAGTYKVTISRTGYVTTTRTVTVKQGKAASVVVILAAARP